MTINTRFRSLAAATAAGLAIVSLTACGGGQTTDSADSAASGSSTADSTSSTSASDITVGFVAVGPEGGFRTANENDIQQAFKDAGITLKYSPTTNNDQQKQLEAFASFVNEEVDAILLSATEATGWEESLKTAQEAEIPVILLDRGIEPNDESLYSTHIGPSNLEAGKAAAQWAIDNNPDGAKAVVLEGPAGLSVVNERNEGWESLISGSNIEVLENQSANWSTEEGKTVTEGLLDKYNNDIKVIFAQNDEMGLGAAQAVEAKGLTTGKDGVQIITIDGTRPALEGLLAGKLSYVIEYNPIFGKDAVDAVRSLVEGKTVEKSIVVDSASFDQDSITQEIIDGRPY
ncbi:ABC transporter substrate-binding protein [Actinomyces sp. B33]|uniref:ABC transporter substrate-binding protein n=1 Tax=Actinomyces sp. B33 TaxID=2942131 RepID=UPI0023406561|nr:ABC transporter substrate-binding protein [Actinomyces sp. B33]MDC4233834.1 ABC transporter substrate-binding protein [Actinomyces sp. B33]